MALQGVAFLPSRATFYTTFLHNCGRGESLKTTTCPKTVVGVSKGMMSVKCLRSNKASFCVSGISWRSLLCHRVEVNLATLSFWDITGFKTVVFVCQEFSCDIFIQFVF